MSAPPSSGVRGWGRHGRHFSDWRRERSWLGRHTLLAALAGLALPIIVAALTGVFEATPPEAVRAPAEGDIYAQAPEVWDAAYEEVFPLEYAAVLTELVVERGQDGASEWARGVRDGWAEGWNQAVAAMRRAAEDAALPESYAEWRVLNDMLIRDADQRADLN